MYRVLITGAIHSVGIDMLKREPEVEVDFRPDLPYDQILEIIEHYHAIVTRSETSVTREMIDRGTSLKVIARAAVGVANIDVEYATEKGILVMNTPGKNTNSAAELAMALLLAAVRKLTQADASMRQLKWDRHRFQGIELMGKTIGIIGLGNVGHRMAKFCRGFDMSVLAYDPYIPDEVFERNRVTKADLKTVLAESDVISVHVPKNRETTGMIGADHIAKMKPGVVLVNAARGGIIQETALLDALKSGHVAAAGIDTWDAEPPSENPFHELSQVVMAPHIGASTQEAQMRVAETVAAQLPRALRGEVVDYPVNMPQIRMLEGGDVMTSYTVLAEKLGLFAAQFLDFQPKRLELMYRGSIGRHDCTLLRLAFLKGYLIDKLDYVSYVNADLRAQSSGLIVAETEDPGFTDFESAIKCIFTDGERDFTIGGVVFAGPHPRISLVDDFPFEIEPEGTFLAIRSRDRLGVVSSMAGVLDEHRIQIRQFAFSHSKARKRSMFLIRVGKPVNKVTLAQLRSQPHITLVQQIAI